MHYAYYNENDLEIAAWLRQLIADQVIMPGEVDTRSIELVQPDDLHGFTQHHFFAGVGGWSHALQLAGWENSRRIWTGSCPCQPFSNAGQKKGFTDERDLWPDFFRLIKGYAACSEYPPVPVLGEQVEGAINEGWLDRVQADMEKENYAVGSVVLGNHCVGSPTLRQRLYWLAVPESVCQREPWNIMPTVSTVGKTGDDIGIVRLNGGLGNAISEGSQRRILLPQCADQFAPRQTGLGFWTDYDVIPFTDGKQRRIEPGSFPLANGVPARVVRLRGYGNAINPYVAAEFIKASMPVLLQE